MTVAAELMAQRGRNISLAEIARPAGVGVGTLYRAFSDRAALFHAMQLRGYNILIAALNRVEESGLTGADAIESWLNERVELGTQLMLPLHGAPPLTDDASIAARGRAVAALERFLADGRADGTVRSDVNATDIIVCAAMISQPLPHSPGWPSSPSATSAFLSTASVPPAVPCPVRLRTLRRCFAEKRPASVTLQPRANKQRERLNYCNFSIPLIEYSFRGPVPSEGGDQAPLRWLTILSTLECEWVRLMYRIMLCCNNSSTESTQDGRVMVQRAWRGVRRPPTGIASRPPP